MTFDGEAVVLRRWFIRGGWGLSKIFPNDICSFFCLVGWLFCVFLGAEVDACCGVDVCEGGWWVCEGRYDVVDLFGRKVYSWEWIACRDYAWSWLPCAVEVVVRLNM